MGAPFSCQNLVGHSMNWRSLNYPGCFAQNRKVATGMMSQDSRTNHLPPVLRQWQPVQHTVFPAISGLLPRIFATSWILRIGGEPYQPHPGTHIHCCGCSLPGLTGFTTYRCGGTHAGHHEGRDYIGICLQRVMNCTISGEKAQRVFPAGIIPALLPLQLPADRNDRLQCAKLTSSETVACI